MLGRYTTPAFRSVWSDKNKYKTWLRVELAICEAQEENGFLVPAGTTQTIKDKVSNLDINPEAIEAIEATTRHDVIAFLTYLQEFIGDEARFIHMGVTSSDIVDTSTAILLRESNDCIVQSLYGLIGAFAKKVKKFRNTPIMGRSHGMHAQPTTFGYVLSSHLAEMKRALDRVVDSSHEISVGTISGAVGNYAHSPRSVEAKALTTLGLVPETAPTQVVARDRYASYINSLALVAIAIERFALQVRHWQRTEVNEAEEGFSSGQKGSSAMPHKKNPITSENLCGLARMMRSYASVAMENTALWHERDISHSSVERHILPDATSTLHYMITRTAKLVDELVVKPDSMKRNLESSGGIWASEDVLLALVKSGVPRQTAYVWVQRSALGAKKFKEAVETDPDITRVLSKESVSLCFSLERNVDDTNAVIDNLIKSCSI